MQGSQLTERFPDFQHHNKPENDEIKDQMLAEIDLKSSLAEVLTFLLKGRRLTEAIREDNLKL